MIQLPPTADALALARQVIDTEIAGLTFLRDSLGPSFTRTVDCLMDLSGRIVVTGIGKSGHIARKIAATFASTGAPAQFVHPGEASHGDLGMITRGDAVMALSNSGEAPELADVIAYTRRFGIQLIGVTAVETSSLAKACDIVILLPQAAEACSLGLAPTTSTTMMMALGDALAVALLERKGFDRDDYRLFHPGGRLGRALTRVATLMHTDALPLVAMDTPVGEVIYVMTTGRFGCAGVIDAQGSLAGIVTDGDLRRHLTPTVLTEPVHTIMTLDPQTIAPSALAGEALRTMTERDRPILVLFVVDGGRPVGILHIHDLLQAGVM